MAAETLPNRDPSVAIKQKLTHFLEYALIRLTAHIVCFFPLAFVLWLARWAGVFLFQILKRPRQRALENLRNAYGPEKTEKEIQQIARGAFRHLAEFGAEWLYIPRIAQSPERYLKIHHVERIHRGLEKGRGALLLVSHIGNWEIMALIGGLLIARPVGASIYSLARPIKNPYLYDYILGQRGLTGLTSITKTGGVKEVFSRLKENGIVCMLIDQRVSEGSVETEFFNQEALTTSLPAIVALRLGTPVFFVFLNRTPDLRYEMEIEGPVPIGQEEDSNTNIRLNTQAFNDRVEAEIRKYPTRWLWMHNRWRARHDAKD